MEECEAVEEMHMADPKTPAWLYVQFGPLVVMVRWKVLSAVMNDIPGRMSVLGRVLYSP